MVALIRACDWSRLAASGSDRRGGLGRIVRRDARDVCLAWMNALSAGDPDVEINL